MKLLVISMMVAIVACQDFIPYFTPAGTQEYLTAPMESSYSCGEDGMHADIQNNCQIFHMCEAKAFNPAQPENMTMLQYTFVCPFGTVFDQQYMVCTMKEDGIQCGDSVVYYSMNQRIGTDMEWLNTEDLVEREAYAPTQRGNRLSEQLQRDLEWGTGNARLYKVSETPAY